MSGRVRPVSGKTVTHPRKERCRLRAWERQVKWENMGELEQQEQQIRNFVKYVKQTAGR